MRLTSPDYFTLSITILCLVLLSQATPLIDVDDNTTLSRERRQTCRFRCSSGECIEDVSKCDGIKDCSDGSDETAELCRSMNCPGYAFKCTYGACVDGDARCNGITECPDSSDEDSCPNSKPIAKCKRGEFTCRSGFCISIVDLCDGKKDCNDGSDETESACGTFSCPSYTFRCSYGGCIDATGHCDGIPHCADGSDELCDSKSPAGPVTVRPPPVVTPNVIPLHIDETFVCDPPGDQIRIPPDSECGTANEPAGVTFVLRGSPVLQGEFPWHAAIFRRESENDEYENQCGGSLISSRLVVSAAHCFWDPTRNKPDQPKFFKIGLGKYNRAWKSDIHEQGFNVEKFQINCYYRHDVKYFDDDMAIAILQEKVTFTDFIKPICIDWKQTYVSTVTYGKVPGWGLTQSYNFSTTLKKVHLPLVDQITCQRSFPKKFGPYISKRKFCAGYRNGTGVCQGDSGGGLVYKNQDNQLWYLRGFVSAGIPNTTVNMPACSQQDYALFTDVYQYLPWLSQLYT